MNRNLSRLIACAALLAGTLGLAGAGWAADVKSETLDAIKQRDQLICGVDTGIPGFAFQDSGGKWQGLDIAYCRAIAAAVLGDPEKVKYVGTTAKVRFSVLQSGEIDVLIRDSTHTLTRNTDLGLATAKLAAILVFLLLTTPTAAYALANAARLAGVVPLRTAAGKEESAR